MEGDDHEKFPFEFGGRLLTETPVLISLIVIIRQRLCAQDSDVRAVRSGATTSVYLHVAVDEEGELVFGIMCLGDGARG
jgi:hypothetical protein